MPVTRPALVLAFACFAAPPAPADEAPPARFAGTGKAGFAGDGGPALEAQFAEPFLCDFDGAGRLLVADMLNHRIRSIDLKTGVISTVAGSGAKGFGGDGGPALKAAVEGPYAVAVDRATGDLYVVEEGSAVVRKIDGKSGTIAAVAGGGAKGFGGDGGPATEARMVQPHDTCLDGRGGLLIADVGDWRVRRLDLKTGVISTFAGTGKPAGQRRKIDRTRIGDGGHASDAVVAGARAVCVDGKGNTFICEREGNAVRKVDAEGVISTVAGTGDEGYGGDGGPALKATFRNPKGVRCDRAGNLYVVDSENHAVRRIDAATGVVTTVAGGKKGPAGLDRPHGVALDADGTLYIADTMNHRILKLAGR